MKKLFSLIILTGLSIVIFPSCNEVDDFSEVVENSQINDQQSSTDDKGDMHEKPGGTN